MEGIKWFMLSSTHFVGEKEGYVIDLRLGSGYPIWTILKDGQMLDAAHYHPPVTSDCNKELAGKVDAGKYLYKLINKL